MDLALLLIRLLLAGIFLVSGLARLVDRPGSHQALLDFGAPAWLARPGAVLLPLSELAVAGLLLLTVSAWWGALGSLALLMFFTAAVGYHLARGRTPRCHCFGQASSEPVGRLTLLRNLILVALAALIVGYRRSGDSVFGWLGPTTLKEQVELSLAGLTVALLIAGVVLLLRVGRTLIPLLQRVQELETTLADQGKKARAAMPPPAIVPLRAPAFHLPDLSGTPRTLDALLARGRPVLLLFFDPECGPCTALLPTAGRWQREYARTLTVAVISRGTPAANRTVTRQSGIELILLQHDREVAAAYQAQGTPCAVLIHADGMMRSGPACGAEQIRALVAQTVRPSGSPLPAASGREPGRRLPIRAPQAGSVPSGVPSEAGTFRPGDLAPTFTLPDLDGQPVSLHDFRREPVLLLFWNPGCSFCTHMLPDLQRWELSQDIPRLLVISTGSIEQNRELGLHAPVLLDPGPTVGPALGIHGTPMDVLLDEQGHIASDVAAGAAAIFALARSHAIPARPGS